jgi:FAD/FMN-containing dehydrogenase
MSDLFDRPADYQEKRDRLVEAMKRRHAGPVMLKKSSSSNLFRNRSQISERLDVRDLNRVITVDPKKLIVEVEGMTTYEQLVKATLQYNCLPTVVPQLNTITIGGAIAGGGIESSSFRYGLVHETVIEMEILLSNGTVIVASLDQYADLFYGVPNTFGTLGYILKLKVKLVPIKAFVHLQHVFFSDASKFFQTIDTITETGKYNSHRIDFMDGSVYERDQHYLTLGTLVDTAPYTSNYTYMKMYYRSISSRQEDYLTIHDYIWRWDPDWFWCSDRFGADKWLIRLLFGKWLLHSKTYWQIIGWDRKYQLGEKLSRLRPHQPNHESVIQDVQIPIEHAPTFLDFLHRRIGILPIWICPAKDFNKHRFDFLPLKTKGPYINFGFWDFVETDRDPTKGYYNRLIEKEIARLGGTKGLYSESYYTSQEFWQIYDQKRYNHLKQVYDPEHVLKDFYQKTIKRA